MKKKYYFVGYILVDENGRYVGSGNMVTGVSDDAIINFEKLSKSILKNSNCPIRGCDVSIISFSEITKKIFDNL